MRTGSAPPGSESLPLRHRLLTSYLSGPEHRFKTTAARLLRGLLRLEHVLFQSPSGARFALDPGDYLQDQMLRHGASEPRSLALLSTILPEAGVFVDVGGHVGQYAIEAALVVGARGRVVAFEPDPQTFSRLKANVALNGLDNITLVLAAATSRPGLLAMQEPPPGNRGMSRTAGVGPAAYRVAGVRIADTLREIGVRAVDAAKVDIEGHELEALEGLFFGEAFRPRHLLVEFVPDAFAYGFALPAYLRERGYELFTVLGEPYDGQAHVPEGNLWARRL